MRIFILFLFVAGLSPVFGQTRFGAEAGVNFARVGSYYKDNGRLGIHAGLFAQLPSRSRFSLRTGVQYSLKGLNASEYFYRQSNGLQFDFHYLSVPITASYKLSERISFSLGPVVSYLLASRVTQGGNTLGHALEDDGFPDWDLGWQFGAAYNFKSGFGLYARFEGGFANMDNTILMNDQGSSVGRFSSGANRVWQLGASYTFPMRRGQ